MEILNKAVVFRSHRGDRLGVIKGILYDDKSRTTIATIQLDKSEREGKSGPFSSILKSLGIVKDKDKLVRIPLNLLHILSDVEVSKEKSHSKNAYTPSSPDAPPNVMVIKGVAFHTMTTKQRESYKTIFNPGDQVIWNKTSEEMGSANLGTVYLLARNQDIQHNVNIRAYVDFDQKLPSLYNDEQISTLPSGEQGKIFRYCVPYEDLMGLQDYLASFQQFSEQPTTENAKSSNGKAQNDDKGNGNEESLINFGESNVAGSSSGEWKVQQSKKHSSQIQKKNANKNNSTQFHTSHANTEYSWGNKKYFALCCARNKVDLTDDDIPIQSTVAYLAYERVFGKVLWTGNAALYAHPHLEATTFVQVEFESKIWNSIVSIEHASYCGYFSSCRDNKQLFISVEDLKDISRFKIYPIENTHTEDLIEDSDEDETKEISTEIPSPLYLPSVIQRLKKSDEFGFQGCNNSCYADTTLFSLFAFTDVFDDHLLKNDLQRQEEDSASNSDQQLIHAKTLRILREYIVAPLRKNFLVQKDSVARLRRVLGNINPDFKNNHMDAEDFMLCLFDTVLGVPPFFQYDEDSTDYIHQIMLPCEDSPTIENCMELQLMLQNSFFTSQVQLDKMPFPGFIIKLPVCDGKLMCSKYVMPGMELEMTHFLKDPKGKTSMDLLSVICLRDHHFTCYIRTAADWVFYDSNPSGQKPKVINLPFLTEALAELSSYLSKTSTYKSNQAFRKEDDKHAKLLMSSAYICIYI